MRFRFMYREKEWILSYATPEYPSNGLLHYTRTGLTERDGFARILQAVKRKGKS